jgi:hypothetical protein
MASKIDNSTLEKAKVTGFDEGANRKHTNHKLMICSLQLRPSRPGEARRITLMLSAV